MSSHVSDQPVWDDRPMHRYPPLRGQLSAEVCVVGLGGSGLAAIDELRARGVSVVGVDAGRVGGGAAGRNAGFFLGGTPDFHHRAVEQLGAQRATALYRLTLDELETMLLATPEALRRTGSLRLASDVEELEDCRLQLLAMQEAGIPVEAYEGPDGTGLFFPLDCAGQPLLRVRRMAAWTHMRGARLFEDTPAVRIDRGRVRTPRGTVSCDAVIVAVDGRLERLLPELRPRVRTARLQVLATAPEFTVTIPMPCYARYGYEYWQQTPDRRVVLGGLRDLAGATEDTDVAEPTERVQTALTEVLRLGLGVLAPVTHRWAGVVAYTESRLPVVEQVRDGVWATGAYSGTGNLLGAVCARAVVERIVGVASRLDGVLFDVAVPG